MKKIRIITAFLLIAVFLCGCSSAAQLKISYEPFANNDGKEWKVDSFASSITAYESAEQRLSQMTEVAADGKNRLYFDPATCDIALQSDSGLYFSTPWNLAADSKSVETQKVKIASQLHLTYMNAQQNIAEIFSFNECIAKGQYTLKRLENGVQVDMVIGRAEQRTLLPAAMPTDSFDKVLEQLSKRQQTRMKAFYKLYDAEKTPENQIELIREKFPVIDEMPIYVLKQVTENEMAELEGYLAEGGYTFDDMDRDLKTVGASETESVNPRFEISVRYELSNGELSVSVPTSLIKYDDSHFQLLEIGILEYFAAADCTQDGYAVVPDGSGAVIGFNSQGTKLGNDVRIPIYGYDRALSYNAGYEKLMTATIPVFGMVSPSGSLFAIVEDGAAMGDIVVSSGGNTSCYARVGVSFAYSDYDSFEYKDVNTKYSWTLSEKSRYEGTYRIRYALLDAGAGYPQMAAYYRDSLNLKETDDAALRLVLGLYGTVRYQDQILFVPVKRQIPLTTFKDAGIISDEMTEKGVEALDLRYIGWSKNGLAGRAYTDASVQKALGGKSALKKLNKQLEEKNIGLYMDADMVYVGSNGMFDAFNASGDTGRMLDKTYAGFTKIRFSSGLVNGKAFKYALRPEVMLQFFKKFDTSYQKLGIKGLSLSTMGNNLNSNKNAKNGVNRDIAQRYAQEVLSSASKEYRLMVDGGNRYCYESAAQIIDLPLSASGYTDADYAIPFLPMVLHGKVHYTTKAVNLSGNYRAEVLKAIENGSGLYFELAYENAEILKSTDFANAYSVDYGTWKDRIVECYQEVQKAVGDLAAEPIIDHSQVADGVFKTVYASSTAVYVNYNATDIEADGITVPANGYYRAERGSAQ
ncbi:MAG: hypothetical protein IKI29_03905 [Clostridia bacterium]|nr:hypothetical protein [Clostridia bacterium]